MNASPSPGSEQKNVVSPFAEEAATLPTSSRSQGRFTLWIVLGIAFVVIGAGGGILVAQRLNDPLRTLEKFPVAKYLDNYHALSGARFKGELRVEADLGWKENIGRLMVFSVVEDPRPIVVMIPAQFSNIYFSKGQSFVAELEVKEGGLIYANSCRKN
jgi:hypothetical protein